MNKFYLALDGKAEGPFSAQKIVEMLRTGEITDETLWSRDGDENWKKVSEGMDLDSALFQERKQVSLADPEKVSQVAQWNARSAEWKRLSDRATVVSQLGVGSFVLAGLGIIVGLTKLEDGGWPAWIGGGGGLIGFGLCLIVVAQLMHIRASMERR